MIFATGKDAKKYIQEEGEKGDITISWWAIGALLVAAFATMRFRYDRF